MTLLAQWSSWLELTLGVLLIGIGAQQWRRGGRALAALGLLMISSGSGNVLPPSYWWVRPLLWAAVAVLLAWALVTLPREVYRKMRLELALGGAAVALMWMLTLVQMPPLVEIPLLVVMGTLFTACLLATLARGLKTRG